MTGRTLVITNDFPPRAGGIQSFVHGLVTRQPQGSIVVYAPKWAGDAAYDAAQPFPVYRHRGSLMLPDPPVLKMAREIIAKEGCDRVLYGATAPLGLLSGALRKSGIKRFVGLTHGHEASWAVTPGGKQALHRIGEETDTITYLGEYTRQRIASALSPEAAARMVRLVPGVDDETFHPRNKAAGRIVRERLGLTDNRVIVCVSRLMPRKGQDTLIKALPLIKAQVPDAALVIVGGGPYRKKLETLAAASPFSGDIRITGSVPYAELPSYYAAGDIFAMPCRTRTRGLDVEGLGIVYLEASATGLPVIAGDSGGAPDAVIQGETGLVVDGRSEEELAEAAIELLSDPELCERMGAAGRQWIEEKWRWPSLAARLDDLLNGRQPVT